MTRARLKLVCLAGAVAMVATAAGAYVHRLGPPPLGKQLEYSHVVLDRDGKLLRAYATPDGRWRLAGNGVKDVDPRFLDLLFAYEDKRFPQPSRHRSVGDRARRPGNSARNGRIVSGGSTLTMQVARLLEPRSIAASWRQTASAHARAQLEYLLSKDDILRFI